MLDNSGQRPAKDINLVFRMQLFEAIATREADLFASLLDTASATHLFEVSVDRAKRALDSRSATAEFGAACVELIRLRPEGRVHLTRVFAQDHNAIQRGIAGADLGKLVAIRRSSRDFEHTLDKIDAAAFKSSLIDARYKGGVFPSDFQRVLLEVAHQAMRGLSVRVIDRGDRAWPFNKQDDADVPASDRFVRIDDNRPDVEEAADALEKIKDRITGDNRSVVLKEERDALASEIMILIGMLQQRAVRLGYVQSVLVGKGTLGYIKGRFKDDIMAALVGKAVEHLLKIGTGH
ncbi:hypothetical protein [Paracraurococcus lichenis]|uniref:Uncharacterized protein n=1 Tax=Paracraurococcus lichenis TaxID=3064888 RepID=A0ABT9E749_9PROT|nr:hypothetical protein [Paracraurococcus sp. LOR1-02]MDO9711984.1 hypothetical protein [Paracraurococcus sp. LOR1-02]